MGLHGKGLAERGKDNKYFCLKESTQTVLTKNTHLNKFHSISTGANRGKTTNKCMYTQSNPLHIPQAHNMLRDSLGGQGTDCEAASGERPQRVKKVYKLGYTAVSAERGQLS